MNSHQDPGDPGPGRNPAGAQARRNRSPRIGLRAKVVLSFAGLLLAVTVAVLATQKGPIVRVFERDFRGRGSALAINLAARASHRLKARRPEELGDLLEVFLEFEDVSGVAIVMPGKQSAAGTLAQSGFELPRELPPLGQVTAVEGDGAHDFLAHVPGTDGVAVLRLSDRKLSSTVSSIGTTIAAIAATAVGAGFLLVFLAAGAFTKPIEMLADLARRIRAGELGAQLELRRAGEVGELIDAMNAMSIALHDKEQRLRRAKQAAEARSEELDRQGRELAAQTRSLETLVASITEGVLFLGLDRRVVIANHAAERIVGLSPLPLQGRALDELRFPEPERPVEALLEQACEHARRGERYESQVRVEDHFHAVTTVHDTAGDVAGVLAVVQDLSKIRALEAEQKELRDQLYQQEKMAIVGLLAASLAHDINTPLGTILLHTQLVARQVEDPDQVRALETVVGEVHRCRQIVHRLLDFSRAAEGARVDLHPQEPLDRCIALAEADLRRRGIAVQESVAPDVPVVRGDPNQIEQVLMNLISNSADAMPKGGRIEVHVLRHGDGAEIRVRDEGTGISPEDLPRVCEPFFTRKPRSRGTGLGLAICQRIMEEHHGSMEVRPRARGGTEVRLLLPAADGDHA